MKVVFYSTNSNHFDDNNFKINIFPSNDIQFENFTKKYPEHEFICISQKPSFFMPETKTIFIDSDKNYQDFTQKILKLKPDLAIALSYWQNPYDWLNINDALVKEELEKNDIKTICNSVETGLICFDKNRTHHFFKENNFLVPESIFVDHDLFFCAGSNKEVISNVYKESVYSQLSKLKYPLIIKDTVGLSSYGMTVLNTFGEAKYYLNSKRNNSNRIIQEYIQGEHFGVEIYGIMNNYKIMEPFKFSTNQYGITCPKLSSKYGPLNNDEKKKYKINELNDLLLRLANLLKIQGCAQIDLIFSDNKWYFIEINPRLSGMSYMYCSRENKSVFDFMFNPENICSSEIYTTDIKLPVQLNRQLEKLSEYKQVKLINQNNNVAYKQEREKGFCEVVICSKTKEENDLFIKDVIDPLTS